MYLLITIPILIANFITVPYTMWDIIKQYKHTTLKPRLIMFSILMLANIPSSILTVLASLINNGWLEHPKGCYTFIALNLCVTLKGLALMALTTFVSLLVLKKYNTQKLNKIGNILCLLIIPIFLFIECVLIPLGGMLASKKFEVAGRTYNRFCGPKASWLNYGLHIWMISVSFATLFTAFWLFMYSYFKDRIRMGTSYARICITFVFYAIINALAMNTFILKFILGIELSENAEFVLFDMQKIVPSLFAATYLIFEAASRRTFKHYNSERIINSFETRELFKQYLARIKEKKQHKLLEQWDRIDGSDEKYFEVLDNKELTKNKAHDYIEKHLEIDVFGFLCSEEFIDYYEVHHKKGLINAALEEELSDVT